MGLFGQKVSTRAELTAASTHPTPAMSSPAHALQTSAPTATSSITLSTSCTATMLSPTHTPSSSVLTTADTADLSCPHCLLTFPSRIGLVGHLQIHRTETGEPVPGAPIYTRRIRLYCPHCTRTFIHSMDLLGHMHVHENLRLTTAGCITPSHPPPPASHRISISPTSNNQLPSPMQVGGMHHGFFTMRSPICMCDRSPRLLWCVERRGSEGGRLTSQLSPRRPSSCVCLSRAADWWAESQAEAALSPATCDTLMYVRRVCVLYG
ncbi:hypothetical protein SprV_0100149900 [Sparganum proliferum]